MTIKPLLDSGGAQTVLWKGAAGRNGTLTFFLRDTTGSLIDISSGYNIRMFVTEQADTATLLTGTTEITATIVDDGTEALRGKFTVDLSTFNLTDEKSMVYLHFMNRVTGPEYRQLAVYTVPIQQGKQTDP